MLLYCSDEIQEEITFSWVLCSSFAQNPERREISMCSGMGRQCASLLEEVDLCYSSGEKILLRFTNVTVTA